MINNYKNVFSVYVVDDNDSIDNMVHNQIK